MGDLEKRGIVIEGIVSLTVPTSPQEDYRFKLRRLKIDDKLMRFLVTYWDEICIPEIPFMHSGFFPTYLALEEEGVLKRFKIRELERFYQVIFLSPSASAELTVDRNGGLAIGNGTEQIDVSEEDFGLFISEAPRQALHTLNSESKDTIWSIMKNSGSESISCSNYLDQTNLTKNVFVQLMQGLPCPPDDAYFDDILKFKQDRKDQLCELRMCIEKLALVVSSAQDRNIALSHAMKEINIALKEVNTVLKEKWYGKILGVAKNPGINVNLGGIFAGSVATASSYIAGLEALSAIFIEFGIVVFSCMSWDFKNSPRYNNSYQYIADMQHRFH
jgi:Family of unknown function (DUF6236)